MAAATGGGGLAAGKTGNVGMIGSGIEMGAGAIESTLGTLGISAVIGDGAAAGTAAGTAAGMAATAGTAAVGRGFIDGSEGITNGRGAEF